jgi:hypothetical protein
MDVGQAFSLTKALAGYKPPYVRIKETLLRESFLLGREDLREASDLGAEAPRAIEQ